MSQTFVADTYVTLTTPSGASGAVALLQLHGPQAEAVLSRLTGRANWPVQRLFLVRLGGIDEGLATVLEPGWAQIMPHGGVRVVQRLLDWLGQQGIAVDPEPDPQTLYPEADSELEAWMLQTLALAPSPAAIDLLLRQPAIWQKILQRGGAGDGWDRQAILAQSRLLDRLLHPPMVVVAGRPNVGKSTLTNAMLGRSASIVADLPGTTRDWVGGMAELRGIAVRWLDTPGIRSSGDVIEQQAIELSREVVADADVLIALGDPDTPWPQAGDLAREPDLWVINKIDTPGQNPQADRTAKPGPAHQPIGSGPEHPIPISAKNASGLDPLIDQVLDRLGLAALPGSAAWAFCQPLRQWCLAAG